MFVFVSDFLTLAVFFVATCLCLSVDNAQTEACYVTQMWEMCGYGVKGSGNGVGVGEGRDGVVGRCPGLVFYFLHFLKEINVGFRRVLRQNQGYFPQTTDGIAFLVSLWWWSRRSGWNVLE